MLRISAFIALSVALAAPVSAQTFRAENRVDVTAVPGGFSVANGGGQGARGMWCAAADYARRVLGAPTAQRLYVAQESGGSRRGPAVFTLSDAGLTPSSVTIVGGSVRTPGANLSIGHALAFCADHKLVNR